MANYISQIFATPAEFEAWIDKFNQIDDNISALKNVTALKENQWDNKAVNLCVSDDRTKLQLKCASGDCLAEVDICHEDGYTITRDNLCGALTVNGFKEKNSGTTFSVWVGTQAQFDALTHKDSYTRYEITDETTLADILADLSALDTGLTQEVAERTASVQAVSAGLTQEVAERTAVDNSLLSTINGINDGINDGTIIAGKAKQIQLVDNSYASIINILLDMVYPVGSIYMSVRSVSPATFLGGSWATWGTGKVPVGVDTHDSNFNVVEATGGRKDWVQIKHAHQISNDLINISIDSVRFNSTDKMEHMMSTGGGSDWVFSDGSHSAGNAGSLAIAGATNTEGVEVSNLDLAKANLQPYITCYMWKRTA